MWAGLLSIVGATLVLVRRALNSHFIRDHVDVDREIFHVSCAGMLAEHYSVDTTANLGQGSYANVFKATNVQGFGFAIKLVSKDKSEARAVANESSIMRRLNHPNILKLYETLEDSGSWYLVTELCCGGELLSRLLEVGTFTELQASMVMQQIFGAVRHMHTRHIAHCDLKPENILFKNDGPVEGNTLKLIDFGLSQVCCRKGGLEGVVGNPYYVAPQVLSGKYDMSCDMWSCGALMYLLLAGYPPFFADTDAEVLMKVLAGHFEFNEFDWRYISQPAKTLVLRLLTIDVEKRYTAKQAVSSRWVTRRGVLLTLLGR